MIKHIERPKTLVIGAGAAGSMSIDLMQNNGSEIPGVPIVVVDDDKSKVGTNLHGVPVAGTTDDIPDLVDKLDIEQILLAIPSAPRRERMRIFDICSKTDTDVFTVPSAFLGMDVRHRKRLPMLEIDVADLLSRPEIKLDMSPVRSYIEGKTVLVTGGGGSIGSEICRQLVNAQPEQIVIFDIYENTAYELLKELNEDFGDEGIRFIVEVGSVRDNERLDLLFEKYHPQVVFHAAAHKHVPLMEGNPREAILNNVLGTLNVVEHADEYGAEHFVLISTDKAVNPTNVMGATKRMCEMVVQYFARHSKTVFTAVRFGNVLGSHGSVIPLFKRQIRQGGPVTLTHKDIVRYFMTIPEASRLVIQAGALSHSGDIFVLDMGDPVRIYDLAENLIRMAGYFPGEDIEIVVTGLRPGEKLYEELEMESENLEPTSNKAIRVVSQAAPEVEDALLRVEKLHQSLAHGNQAIKDTLQQVVPTYHPAN